jgi:hypothetical protein
MATVDINDRYVGADWDIPVVVPDLPALITAISATFVLKKSIARLDSDDLFTKEITTTATPEGQITQVGTTATLRFLFDGDTETSTLEPRLTLYYKVYMANSEGFEEVVADGDFIPQ